MDKFFGATLYRMPLTMDLLAALRTNQLNQFKTTFRWKTKEGRTVSMGDMDSNHLFNTAKLLWNKWSTDQHRNVYVRGPNSYASQFKNGHTIFFFIWEIETRDDLPPNKRAQYHQWLNQVFDSQFLLQELPAAVRPRPAIPQPQQPEFNTNFDFAAIRDRFSRLGSSTRDAADAISYMARTALRPAIGPPTAENEPRLPHMPDSYQLDEEESRDMSALGSVIFSRRTMLRYLISPRGEVDPFAWLAEVPMKWQRGAHWAVDQVSRRQREPYSNNPLRFPERRADEFIAIFRGFKEPAITARDLNHQGWTVPQNFPHDGYIRHLRGRYGRTEFERRVLGMFEIHADRNRRQEERPRVPNRPIIFDEMPSNYAELERRVLLAGIGNLGTPPTAADSAHRKAEAKKETKTEQTVEQLTTIGRRKIQVDGEEL